MKVVAHNNTSTLHSYEVVQDGQPFDLTQAGVEKVEVAEGGQVISSDTADVEYSGTTLKIRWGALDIEGIGTPTVYIYKTGDSEGEAIIGPGLENHITLQMNPDDRL